MGQIYSEGSDMATHNLQVMRRSIKLENSFPHKKVGPFIL